MKRKEWAVLLLLMLVVGGAAYGLFSYKSATTTESAKLAAPSTSLETSTKDIPDSTPGVRLWVTRDFGATVLFDQRVPLTEGQTVMEVLKKNVSGVETAYNGGFVTSIQGLASTYSPSDATSKKLDWFYSVNGLMAEIGSAEYPLQNNDVVWWDYHDWSYAMRTPGQIGAFPHPFVKRETGESIPVQIMAMEGSEKEADLLAESLSKTKAQEVKVVDWNEGLFDQEQALILVGDRNALLTSPFVNKIWKERESLGIFAALTQEGIQLYDQLGKANQVLTDVNSSVLVSTKNPTNLLPILVVSGNSQKAIELASNQLINLAKDQSSGLRLHYGAALDGEKIIRLPILPAAGATP